MPFLNYILSYLVVFNKICSIDDVSYICLDYCKKLDRIGVVSGGETKY